MKVLGILPRAVWVPRRIAGGFCKMVAFDGKTPSDVKLWHTYVWWARLQIAAPDPRVIVDAPANRIDPALSRALQTVVFSAFALEYRLRRVLEEMGQTVRPRTTLSQLLTLFWIRLGTVDRLDGSGKCAQPAGWNSCEGTLKSLGTLRNSIAHANYDEILKSLRGGDPTQLAKNYYNAVIEAIKLINIGTGYDTRSRVEIDGYFEVLKAM